MTKGKTARVWQRSGEGNAKGGWLAKDQHEPLYSGRGGGQPPRRIEDVGRGRLATFG